MNKKTIITMAIVAVVGAGILGSGNVYAQTPGATQHENFFQGLVQMIAQKFHLDQNQVQTAVTQYQEQQKTKMQQQQEQRLEQKLTNLVQQGKITDAQKTAILNKLADLKKNFDPNSLKNMTPQQRRDALQKQRADLKAWAQQQGIDPQYLMFGMRGGMGMMGKGWKGMHPTPTP